jgi:ankyrin repeat protein
VDEARSLASADVMASLEAADLSVLPEASRNGRLDVVRACLAAGFPVNLQDASGATALHHASIAGRALIVGELLRHGADFRIRDAEHKATALDWACYGADFVAEPGGDYTACALELQQFGARPTPEHHLPQHEECARN